jgi:hypothetical protein
MVTGVCHVTVGWAFAVAIAIPPAMATRILAPTKGDDFLVFITAFI